MAASCSLGSEPVPTTSTTYPAPVAQATAQPGPELARIISSLAAAGDPCEHVDIASPSVLARGAVDEASADCAGENLDIAVFPTVTLDLVQWFTGDAATKAAAEDGEKSPPPNDYYIRNVNPRLRTLPLANDARLSLTRQTLGQGGDATAGVEVDLARLAASGRKHLFWATVQGGRILRLEEQYLP